MPHTKIEYWYSACFSETYIVLRLVTIMQVNNCLDSLRSNCQIYGQVYVVDLGFLFYFATVDIATYRTSNHNMGTPQEVDSKQFLFKCIRIQVCGKCYLIKLLLVSGFLFVESSSRTLKYVKL